RCGRSGPGREAFRSDVLFLGELRDDEVEPAVLDPVGVNRARDEQRGVVVLVGGVIRLALDVELGGDRPADRLYLDVQVLGLARLVGAGDDRGELVAAVRAGHDVAAVAVADHVVLPGMAGVPEADQRPGDRPALRVQYPAGENELRLVTWLEQVRPLGGAQPVVRPLDLPRSLGQLTGLRGIVLPHAWCLARLRACRAGA